MAEPHLLDRMFTALMHGTVETGRAPHYAELAPRLGLTVEDSRRLLLDVMQAYPIGWLHPETDYVASFPPLNNLPTQYRVTVRGEQKWFAQCGFEATSVTWLFPGAVSRLRRAHPDRDARRPPHGRGSTGHRGPLELRLRPLARPAAVSLNGHEPLPVGRARAPLEPVQPGLRGRLHCPARSRAGHPLRRCIFTRRIH